MKRFKKSIALALSLFTLSSLVACGAPPAEPGADTNVSTSKESNSVTPVSTDTLVINGDYIVPPTAHGNPFIGGYIGGGLEAYLQDNLFIYAPFPSGEFKPHLAESFNFENNIVSVKLKEGLKWSDGSPLTAKDIETSYYMNVGKRQVWEYLETIEVVDDLNINFKFKVSSDLMLNQLFDIKINAPTSVYGEWAEKYKEIANTGREFHPETNTYWFLPEANEKLTALNQELESLKIDLKDMIGSGPYTIENITTSEALLKFNENYREDLDIKTLRVMRVITPETAATAMVDGTLDIHSGGIVKDMEEQIIKKVEDYKAYYVSEYSQMSLVFNTQKEPINKKEVRQALAYLVNREEIMPLTEPGSMPSENTATGLPITLQEAWGVKDFAQNELTSYEYNLEKAEEILSSIGWTRNNDDKWIDENGKLVELEIACNNGWSSAMLPGEAIVTRLNEFGLTTQFKPMEGAAFNEYFTKGEHMIAIEFAPTGNVLYAHPYGTYEAIYKSRPFLIGVKPDKNGQLIVDDNGTPVNITQLINELFVSEGEETIKITKELMRITNENVFFIPYLEKGFPLRTLNNKVQLDVPTDEMIKDKRYTGLGPDLFATMIKEKTLTLKN